MLSSRSVKIIAWSLLALVCIWVLLTFALVVFGSVLAVLFVKSPSPIVLFWVLAYLLPFLIFSGLLAWFYVRVATSGASDTAWRSGWIASAIYHFVLLWVSAVYFPGTLQVGPIEGSITLFCAAAAIASVYAFIKGRPIPPVPAAEAEAD
jgi:hypothetical protein